MTEIEQLLVQLITIPSVSGDEKVLGDFIVDYVEGKKLGAVVQRQAVDGERFNVVIRKGKSTQWLVAHMDTVPGHVPIKVTDEAIYGRGACDNKQSVAAALIVLEQLDDINVLFTVGEESDFIGARTAQEQGIAGTFVIIQEPSLFKIKTGMRGIVAFDIHAKGVQQHSSLTNSDSAIHKLITILHRLSEEGWTAFNVGTIHGGVAENIVADSAHAMVLVRPDTRAEYESVLQTLEALQRDDVTITLKNTMPPMESNLGFPRNIAKGFSEMAFFDNSIEFGAGDIAYAHTDNEHILRKDLNMLPEKLKALLLEEKSAP